MPGFNGILIYVVLSYCRADARTPEYLGKKIGSIRRKNGHAGDLGLSTRHSYPGGISSVGEHFGLPASATRVRTDSTVSLHAIQECFPGIGSYLDLNVV